MASDRPVKCPKCQIYFRRSETPDHVYIKGRYWHKECYQSQVSEKTQIEKDRIDLLNYIEILLKKKPDIRILKQIKTFIEEYKYTYKGIELTLQYFFELKNNPISGAQGGIGIVPYVYREAEQYHIMKQEAAEKAATLQEPAVMIKKITIKDPSLRKKFIERRYIDILGL